MRRNHLLNIKGKTSFKIQKSYEVFECGCFLGPELLDIKELPESLQKILSAKHCVYIVLQVQRARGNTGGKLSGTPQPLAKADTANP